MKQKYWNEQDTREMFEYLIAAHIEKDVNMYQKVGMPSILIVEVFDMAGHEIAELCKKNRSVTIFAENSKLEVWISQY